MAIEDEFAIEIPDAEADRIGSVTDAVEYIAAHPMAKQITILFGECCGRAGCCSEYLKQIYVQVNYGGIRVREQGIGVLSSSQEGIIGGGMENIVYPQQW